MASVRTIQKVALSVLMRGAVGFISGFIVAGFALSFLGVSHGHWDLSAPELEQEYRALRLALWIGFGVAVLSVLAGRVRVPRFLFSFVVAFGIICVIPFWPNPKTGGLNPFGTPYVNWGYRSEFGVQLACHVALALFIAGLVHWLWPFVRRGGGHITKR